MLTSLGVRVLGPPPPCTAPQEIEKKEEIENELLRGEGRSKGREMEKD